MTVREVQRFLAHQYGVEVSPEFEDHRVMAAACRRGEPQEEASAVAAHVEGVKDIVLELYAQHYTPAQARLTRRPAQRAPAPVRPG